MAYGFAVGVVGTPGATDGEGVTAVAIAWVGAALVLVPVAFAVAAFVSGRTNALVMLLAGMGLSVAFGLPSLVFQNPLASLIVGLCAGAVATVARPPHTRWYARAIAAAVGATIVIVGMMVAFEITAILAPAVPFTSVGIGDLFARRDPWAAGDEEREASGSRS